MDHARQSTTGGGSVAAKPVGDQPSRSLPLPFQDFAEKALSCSSITTPLHKDIEYIAVLVNGSPQIVLLSADIDEYFVDVPSIPEPTLASLR